MSLHIYMLIKRDCQNLQFCWADALMHWYDACRDTSSARSNLEDGFLNVRAPSMGDLAARLPASWKGDVAWQGAESEESRQLPHADWLYGFWELVNEYALAVPSELSHVLAVPLTDGRLASVDYCRQHAALSSAHLASMDSQAPEWLSACGCICVADSSADKACESMQGEPITTALSVAAAQQGIPLKRLVSEDHLGSTAFTAMCDTLSNLDLDSATSTEQSSIWGVLKQCSIFELLSGVKVNLSASNKRYMLLPNQA